MRDNIINTAIECLRTEGLKFSVDNLASKLKISKKTVYRFFPDKEALSYAIYEKFYSNAQYNVDKIKENGENIKFELLILYFEAERMINVKIFNKYKLNDSIYHYAAEQHNKLWEEILPLIAPAASNRDANVLRAVIEGTFEKAEKYSVSAELAAERLLMIL